MPSREDGTQDGQPTATGAIVLLELSFNLGDHKKHFQDLRYHISANRHDHNYKHSGRRPKRYFNYRYWRRCYYNFDDDSDHHCNTESERYHGVPVWDTLQADVEETCPEAFTVFSSPSIEAPSAFAPYNDGDAVLSACRCVKLTTATVRATSTITSINSVKRTAITTDVVLVFSTPGATATTTEFTSTITSLITAFTTVTSKAPRPVTTTTIMSDESDWPTSFNPVLGNRYVGTSGNNVFLLADNSTASRFQFTDLYDPVIATQDYNDYGLPVIWAGISTTSLGDSLLPVQYVPHCKLTRPVTSSTGWYPVRRHPWMPNNDDPSYCTLTCEYWKSAMSGATHNYLYQGKWYLADDDMSKEVRGNAAFQEVVPHIIAD